MSQQENNNMQKHFYRASAADFSKIPGSPIAYWVSKQVGSSFQDSRPIGNYFPVNPGIRTGKDEWFLRLWFEVSKNRTQFNLNSNVQMDPSIKWFPLHKGGNYRKWYGNAEHVIDLVNNGENIKAKSPDFRLRDDKWYFRPFVSWSRISSADISFRYFPDGVLFSDAGPGIFAEKNCHEVISLLNSKLGNLFLKIINPTLNYQKQDVESVPYISIGNSSNIERAISLEKEDWDSFEASWGFVNLPLLRPEYSLPALRACYLKLRTDWHKRTLELCHLEENNNRLFIDAYGLHDELTSEVPLSEITLTCNPHYRYGGNLSDEEREARLQSDTIVELISYAIGCMMGRYSLDREGLVYAHAGNEGFKALMEEGAYATFVADEDGILPLSTDSWFEDDVATRLEAFVCTVWGKETLEENLQFIADSLCLAAIKLVKKGGETARETLRRYLSTQFFKDHMKTYKKRPIYWLFSSGKEKAFECLVYLHRYNEATLPRMRTEYVTPLLGQMAGRIERLRLQQTEASTSDAKRIGKEIDSLTKQLSELRAFDDQLKHHADMRITLDLDDGVKVNYGKFGTLLSDVKAITGDKGE